MATLYKLEPHRTMYLRGFDRRGAAASLHNASASGFTVSGCWSDQADFAVAVLFDADDQFGHLYTSRYLPDFSLAGVTLDFDLALTGCQNPISSKYQSVPWGSLDYITRSVSGGVVTETPGTVPLNVTAMTGGAAASCTYTVGGTPVIYDRVQLVYLGNVVFDHVVGAGEAASDVAAAMVAQINVNGGPLMAIPSGASSFTVYLRGGQAEVDTAGTAVTTNLFSGGTQSFAGFAPGVVVINGAGYTIATVNSLTSLTLTSSAGTQMGVMAMCPAVGADGNAIELLEMHKTGTCYITPSGASKLTGGADPTSIHIHLDLSALGLASVRQLWLTFAPALNSDSGPVNPSLVAYAASEWSAVFSNWTVGDSGGVTPLKLAGPGSVTISSSDSWATRAGSGWSQVAGWYVGGFAWQSANAGDTVTITYNCQHSHNLYLGTAVSTAGGTVNARVDGGAAVPVSAYSLQAAGTPISGRRLIASGMAAGQHTLVLTVASGTCVFDYLQAAVLSDPVAPAVNYSAVSCACDFDTGQTYQIAPARLLWILAQAGFTGDIDFYAGVFFALKRVRNGGNFHQATVTLAGTFSTGGGFGGDAVFFNISGTAMGAAVYPADTLATLAQRLVNAINATFVGVCAASTSTAGQFTITSLSPIYGFTLSVSTSSGATGTITFTGDIGAGNEGTWQVDASQASPLNRAFKDYLTDLSMLVKAAGQTMTVAFSQELLAPPDSNDAAPASVTFGFFNYLGTGYWSRN